MTDKTELTEQDIRSKYILRAIKRAGWDVESPLVREEFKITAGRVDVIVANPPFGGAEDESIKQNFPANFRTSETADLNYDFDKCCPFPHEEETILPPAELIADYQTKRAALNAKIDDLLAQIEGKLGGEA